MLHCSLKIQLVTQGIMKLSFAELMVSSREKEFFVIDFEPLDELIQWSHDKSERAVKYLLKELNELAERRGGNR